MSRLKSEANKKAQQKPLTKKSVKKIENPSSDISSLHKSIGNKAVESLLQPTQDSSKKEESIEKKEPKEVKKTANKNEKLASVEQSSKEEVIVKSPTNPYKDKVFQQSIRFIKNSAKNLKKHPTGKSQITELKEASHLEQKEQATNNDQKAHFKSIENSSNLSKEKKFTAESFKESLNKELDVLGKKLPTDADGVKKFKKDKPIEALEENINTNVSKEKENMTGTLATDAKEKNPKKSSLITTKAKAIIKKSLGTKPKPINTKASTPKPKYKDEVSMEQESKSIDEYMEENTLTESQLSKSNEPEFLKALDSKTLAQQKLKEVPQTYELQEKKKLNEARGEASSTGEKTFTSMFSSRKGNFNSVFSKQTDSKKSSQSDKQKINAEFEKIYKKTKEDVSNKLQGITTQVDGLFESGGKVDKAKKRFEENVEERLEDIHGTGFVAFFAGEDTEAMEEVFSSEKQRFISSLNTIFDDIAKIISTGLNESMKIIDEGRTSSKEFYDNLDKKEKTLAKDSLDAFNDRYDFLEENVSAKEQELSQSLARKYKENVNSLRETFDGIKKRVTATWLDAAINAIKGVIETIKKLRQLISDLLSAIQSILPKILEDPLWFVKTLFQGVAEGIELFKKNIHEHLIGGFVKWLTGAMGSMSISIPKDIFSLKGIFSLVMQVLGLGWNYVRKKAVKLLGEPLVNAMETGVEMFRLFRSKGADGIWEHLKDKFNDLKETIMGEIKQMLITQVIMAGIKWMVSLLVPGGGFVKAIMAIKDLIVFFVESAMMLIPTLIKAIKSLASGNVKGVAKAIEEGLSRLIAVIINLFAKLIGLGGLANKVMKIIKRIRKRIDNAINKLILKARKSFKGLVKKGKAKVKGAVKKLISWFKIKVGFKAKDGKKHSLNIEGSEKKPKLIIRSKETQFEKFIKVILDGKDEKRKKLAEKAFSNYQNWRSLVNKKIDKKDVTAQQLKSKKVEEMMQEIAVDMQELFGHNESDLPEYKKDENVIYQPSREGVGEKMTAHVLSKKGKEGTITSSPKGVYKTLFKRKGNSGKKSFYVQGHLLNENMHGSGTAEENLTPLSVQGNKDHSIEIEEVLKRVTKTGGVISYEVDPVYVNRDLDTSEKKRPNKFSDEEWQDIKEIRNLESKKIVPKYLRIKAYLMEKDETDKKFGFKNKKLIESKNIDNPIETDKIESYNVGGEGIRKTKFILKDKTHKELEELNGIGKGRAKDLFDRLNNTDGSDGKRVSDYKKLIGISKEKLDAKNPQYFIVGS